MTPLTPETITNAGSTMGNDSTVESSSRMERNPAPKLTTDRQLTLQVNNLQAATNRLEMLQWCKKRGPKS